jgi:hypothetical protein
MKYLNNREQFLNRDSYSSLKNYKKPTTHNYSILEDAYGAGPFHNDVTWNDSLLGRFINHLIRKASVLIGRARMKFLTSRLEGIFDEIVMNNKLESLTEDDKKLLSKLKIYSIVSSIKNGVDENLNNNQLIGLVKSGMEELANIEDFDDKEKINKELDEFLKFLEGLPKDDLEYDDLEEEEESNEEEEESNEEEVEIDKFYKYYPQMIINLKSISTIINKVSTMKVSPEVSKSNKTHKTTGGETINIISKPNNINPNNILSKNASLKVDNKGTTLSDWLEIAKKNPSNKNKDKNDIILPKDITLVLEADVFSGNRNTNDPNKKQKQDILKNSTKSGVISGGETTKEIGFEDKHTKEAFEKLKSAVNILINKDFYPVTSKFLDDLCSNTSGGNLNVDKKKKIEDLYNEINMYLKDNKNQLDSLRSIPLYKESLDELNDKGKLKSIAKKIAIFSVTIMKFDGENLALSKDLNDAVKKFISSFKLIQQITISKGKGNDESVDKEVNSSKNESYIANKLKRYDSFIRLIKEAESDVDDEDLDDVGENNVKTYFYDNCVQIVKYVESTNEKEYDDLRKKVEEAKVPKFIINGFDPIIDIIRTFNQAYKLYMVDVISKRSNGPGATTLMEYDSFGGKDGPYRNKKIFNQWENCVFDVLGNRKYQVIFDKKTMLRVGDELRPGAGSSLRKFMTDMLDGEKLYSGNGTGAQAKIMDKYFGDSPDDVDLNPPGSNDDVIDSNSRIQEDINKKRKEFSFTKSSKIKENSSVGSFICLDCLDDSDGSSKQYHFLVAESKNEKYYTIFFRSFGPFKSLMKSDSVLKGDIPKLIDTQLREGGKKFNPFFTSINKNSIKNILSPNSKIKISYYEDDFKSISTKEVTVINSYLLTSENEILKLEGLDSIIKRYSGKNSISNSLPGDGELKINK